MSRDANSNKNRRRRKRPVKKQSSIGKIFVIVTMLVVSVASLAKAASLYTEEKELKRENASLTKELEDANQKHEELVQKKNYMTSDEYIEDEAKDKLDMVYPDEIVIKPNEN